MARHRARQANARHGLVESLTGRIQDKFLNDVLFRNLTHARELMAAWGTDYNTGRPHCARGYKTRAGFALHLTKTLLPYLLHAIRVPRAGRLLKPRQPA